MGETRRRVRVCPSTLYRDLKGEAILLQLDTGEYFGLDQTAHRIWQLILEDGDLDRVATRMVDEYDVEAGVLGGDIDSFLQELVERRLVEIEGMPQDSE